MSENVLTLTIVGDGKSGIAALNATAEKVNATCKAIMGDIKLLTGSFEGLNKINLKSLTDQVAFTRAAVQGLTTVTIEARNAMWDLSGIAADVAKSVMSVGKASATADGQVSRLGANAIKTGDGLGDMGAGAKLGADALEGVTVEAAAAGKSLSGLNRTVSNTEAKMSALSVVKVDFAPLIANIDAMSVSLREMSLAAGQARAAVTSVGSSTRARIAEEAGGGWRSAAGMGFGAIKNASIGITAVGGAAAYGAANFDNELQKVIGNTNMTAAQASAMRGTILRLMRTGSGSSDLMQGYMHAYNFQYRGADADRIMDVGNKLAVGTHSSVEGTAGAVAGVMNAYGHMPASQAGNVANTLHAANINADMVLEILEKSSTKTIGLAANYKVPLADVMAAYGALVQHRLTGPKADTQIGGILGQIAAPSPKALKEADKLGLSDVFNSTGLETPGVGLYGIVNRVREAVNGLPVNERAGALKNLFNNKQGGQGMSFLLGQSGPAYSQIYQGPQGTAAAAAGKVDFTKPLYDQQMQQPVQKWKAMMGSMQSTFLPLGDKMIPIFEKLEPILEKLADAVAKVLDAFTKLPAPVQDAVVKFGALMIAGNLLKTFTGISIVLPKIGPMLRVVSGAMDTLSASSKTAGTSVRGVGVEVLAFGPKSDETKKSINRLAHAFIDAGPAIGAAMAGIKTVVTTAFAEMIARIKTFAAGVMAAAVAVGHALVDGIRNGIQAKWTELTGYLAGLAAGLPDPIKKALDMHSPSKVMHKIGQDIAQGLIEGVNSKSAQVREAMERLAIVNKFTGLRAGTHSRADRAKLATEKRSELAHLRVGGMEQAHGHDAFFNKTDMGLSHFGSKWRSGGSDNGSYLTWLQSARAGMEQFGTAHRQWLTENSTQARQFEALWKRIDVAISTVTGKIAKAKVEVDRVSARNERFTQRDQDRIMDTRFQMGDVDAGKAMSYFQGRLSEMGKPGAGDDPSKWEAYAEVLGKVKTLQDQIAESERASVSASMENLSTRFQHGTLTVGQYASGLKDLQAQLSIFETISGRTSDDPIIAPLSKSINGMLSQVDLSTVKSEVADAMRYAKTGKDATGADYSKARGVADLQALLPLAPDKSDLQTTIKNDIAKLSKDTGISESAKEFWKAFTSPLDDLISSSVENLFKRGGQRMSPRKLLQSFGQGELGSMLKFGEGRLSQGIQGAIFGHDGKGNPLSGLFGHGSSHPDGMMARYYGAGKAGKSGGMFDSVGGIFKGAKVSMLEGAASIFGAANALMAATGAGGKKKKFGGLLGGLVGLAAGSMIPGLGLMGGFGLGSNLGGMLGFAEGGGPPIGVPSLVGERGPELFVPSVSGTIFPSHITEAIMRGGQAPGGHHETTIYNGAIYQAADVDQHYQRNSQRRERNTRNAGSIPTTF